MSDIPTTTPVKAFIDIKDYAKFVFELYPHLWEKEGFAKVYERKAWENIFFNEENQKLIPKRSGIYMFVVAPMHAYLRDHTYIFYVGQADDLNRRYGEYLEERKGERFGVDRERIVKFLSYFQNHIYFNYTIFEKAELETAEYYLVDNIYPWANRKHKKEAKAKLLEARLL
jgi:hypothetical protein